jgi:hypothetical protein
MPPRKELKRKKKRLNTCAQAEKEEDRGEMAKSKQT